MLAAHDMIDLMRKPSIVFVDEAVLATMFSAARHASADVLTDVTSVVSKKWMGKPRSIPAPRIASQARTRSASESNSSAFIGVHRRLNLIGALMGKPLKTIH